MHRSHLAETDVTRQYGIPTTTPARTLLDLAAVLRPGRRTAVLRRLVDRPTRPTQSVFEDTFLRFVSKFDLPWPEVNTHVAGYEVDMLWRPQRLIAELDGREFHEIDFEADREKDADLLAHGHRVIRVTWERLTEQTVKEAARFRALLGG